MTTTADTQYQAPHAAPGGVPAAPAVAVNQSSPLAVTSLVMGLASIMMGWTFLVPVAGLVVGIMALQREPQARTMSIWGIVLNALMLAGFAIAAVLAIVGVGLGLAFLPFALF